MAEATLEKRDCANCGAEVRPDTQFCYNCGKELSSAAPDEPVGSEKAETDEKDPGLVELERALAASRIVPSESQTKIEAAAAERRRSRSGLRKPLEIVWDGDPGGSSWIYLISVGVIFVLVLLTVVVTVVWK